MNIPEKISTSQSDDVDDHGLVANVVRMGFTAILALVVALAAVSLYLLSEFNSNLESVVGVHNKKTEYAFGMRDAIRKRAIAGSRISRSSYHRW